MSKCCATCFLAMWCAITSPHLAAAEKVTVLYGEKTIPIENAFPQNDDLWIPASDLTRVSGFELKPEGACLREICIPVDRKPAAGWIMAREGGETFNLSKLARSLNQPLVADRPNNVWSFGPIPPMRAPALDADLAPDFALPDRKGNLVRLSDFRGKKVFLLAWASW